MAGDGDSEYIPLTRAEDDQEDQALMAKRTDGDGELGDATLRPEQELLYHRAVLFLAWFSVLSLLGLSITSFVVSSTTDSVALFGFGLDALLDVATSAVVIWRFHGSSQTVYSKERERISLLVFSGLFAAAALMVGFRSVAFLIKGNTVDEEIALYIVSAVAVGISFFLFVGKLYVGHKIRSKAVVSDGYSSLACGIGSLGVLISAGVHSLNDDVDYLDDIMGFAIAVFLMAYGISLLVSNWKKPEGL